MKNTRLFSLALLVILLVSPHRSTAQPWLHYVYLSEDSLGGEFCTRIIDSTQVVRKIFVLISTPGATAVEFSAPLPSCFGGAMYLSDTKVFPLTMGSSQTGISMDFGACLSGSAIHVLTINILMQGLTENCCSWGVSAYPIPSIPGAQGPIFVGCGLAGFIEGGIGITYVEDIPGTKLDNPNPPDGASNQPLDVRLSWNEHRCDCRYCTETCIDVYFGTSPEPPLIAQLNMFPYEFPFDPGPLQPSTTYYWKLKSYGPDDPWFTPVWSFSTGTGTPIQTTSWGAIKALYNE